jgi:hypothetical protein
MDMQGYSLHQSMVVDTAVAVDKTVAADKELIPTVVLPDSSRIPLAFGPVVAFAFVAAP